MQTYAADRSPVQEREGESTPTPRRRAVRGTPAQPSLLQADPVCTCGGGCPQCRSPFGPEPGARIQTKLEVGEPGDVYEQEADRIADQVMGMREPSELEDAPEPSSAPPRIQRFPEAGESPVIPDPATAARRIVAGRLGLAARVSAQIRDSARMQVPVDSSRSTRQMFIDFIGQAVAPVINRIVVPSAEWALRRTGIRQVLEWFGVDQDTVGDAIREGIPEVIVDGISSGITSGVDAWLENSVADEALRGQLGSAFRTSFTRALEPGGEGGGGTPRDNLRARMRFEMQEALTERIGSMPSAEGTVTVLSFSW